MNTGPDLKPAEKLKIYVGDLPHWELPGNAYFLTFRTCTGYELDDNTKDIVFDAIKYQDGIKYAL